MHDPERWDRLKSLVLDPDDGDYRGAAWWVLARHRSFWRL